MPLELDTLKRVILRYVNFTSVTTNTVSGNRGREPWETTAGPFHQPFQWFKFTSSHNYFLNIKTKFHSMTRRLSLTWKQLGRQKCPLSPPSIFPDTYAHTLQPHARFLKHTLPFLNGLRSRERIPPQPSSASTWAGGEGKLQTLPFLSCPRRSTPLVGAGRLLY